jgi:tetratricopeptide (TPR) repeat protein
MDSSAVLPQLQRALGLHQAGRNAEAWMVLAPLREPIDKDGQALRLYALVAQQVGQIDEAATALKRLAEIENNPPEILGALADMLGSAGRHEDALVHWDRLVALHPDIPDAHLNRAVTAASAGIVEHSLNAAEAGLRRFPGHARLLAARAMALKNAGRIDESVEAFAQAVAADPNRALTRHNQGVALRAACRFDEACEAFSIAERLGCEGAQFHANWAAASLEAGNVDQAADLYRKAIAEDPAHAESKEALTRLEIEYRGGEDAFRHYEQGALQRGTPDAWADWIQALADNNRAELASAVGERALKMFPGSPAIVAAAAVSAGMSGDAGSALSRLATLPAGILDRQEIKIARAQLALRAGQPELAARLAEECTSLDPDLQIAWALLGIAWRLLGDPREHWLCDYDRLVMVGDVLPTAGNSGAEEYAAEVAAALDPLHITNAAPGNQSLRGGTQTSGALFSRPEPAIQHFKEAVLAAARRALEGLPDDPAHPFLRRKSMRLGFSGSWSVRLQGGGFHVQHFHSQGWMSSAYYARLPQSVDEDAAKRHEGWIQFGAPPANLGITLEPRRVVEPKPGRLVLFPSYMWHGTIPFGSGDRLTAAFDYLPL